MNIGKKKSLAVRTLKVGKERIVFLKPRFILFRFTEDMATCVSIPSNECIEMFASQP